MNTTARSRSDLFPVQRRMLVWSVLLAAAALLFATKSSPLFAMNDWVDVNCFLTVGRAIGAGKYPYLDLYEQKGPLLYLLYVIPGLMGEHAMLGIFLMELVCFSVYLFFCTRICALYTESPAAQFLTAAALAVLLPVAPSFIHGAGVEEMMLPFFAYSFYVFLKAQKEERALLWHEAFVTGIGAAYALWIKYTACGFYLGIALGLLIWYLLCRHSVRDLLRAILFFLGGIAALSLPILLWLWLGGALESMIQVYFLANMTSYVQDTYTFPQVVSYIDLLFRRNPTFSVPLVAGLVLFFVQIKSGWQGRVGAFFSVVLSLFGLIATTYYGKRFYLYYSYVFSAYAAFGVLAVTVFLGNLAERFRLSLPDWPKYILVPLCLAWVLLFNYQFSNNRYFLSYSRDDLPQYQFAKIIREKEDPSLLNLGFLDGGFYFASQTLPECRLFCSLNLDTEEISQLRRERNAYILSEDGPDFIVTRGYKLENYLSAAVKLYEIAAEGDLFFEGANRHYTLYRRIR